MLKTRIKLYIFLILSLLNSFFSEFQFRGMTFVGDKYCPEVSYEDPLSLHSLTLIKELGANWVAIVVTEYQDSLESTTIYPMYDNYKKGGDYYTYKTETIEGLTKVINHSHSIGLNVMLKPHIDLAIAERYRELWRGDIGKSYTEDSDWERWFNSYEAFIVKYANLARILNVGMFSLSCELIHTSHQEQKWRNIIKSVRNVYKGILIDSANHDGEEYEKTWWDELDYIGVDAYYLPIYKANYTNLTDMEVDEILDKTLVKLEELSNKFNREVVITEIGFCSGNCDRNAIADPGDLWFQTYYYRKILSKFQEAPFIKGFFWWAWNSDPYYGGPDDTCISPQNKPTEVVLKYYYSQTPQFLRFLSKDDQKDKFTPFKVINDNNEVKENQVAKCKCTI